MTIQTQFELAKENGYTDNREKFIKEMSPVPGDEFFSFIRLKGHGYNKTFSEYKQLLKK